MKLLSVIHWLWLAKFRLVRIPCHLLTLEMLVRTYCKGWMDAVQTRWEIQSW